MNKNKVLPLSAFTLAIHITKVSAEKLFSNLALMGDSI